MTAVDRITEDAVGITLAVPPALRTVFRFLPGQHIAVRRPRDGPARGSETRRTYSICTPAVDPDGPRSLRIGVRLVEGGAFSGYALGELAPGDVLEAMAPTGRFVLDPRPGHFAAVVGGSGITPVLSIASTLLRREPGARFCLVRADRTAASAMFLQEVVDLKDRWPDRFQLVTVLSREERRTGPPSGRLDAGRLTWLLPALVPVRSVDGWFLCGPHGLVRSAQQALSSLGVDRSRVHQEIFHAEEKQPPGTGGPEPGGFPGPGGSSGSGGALVPGGSTEPGRRARPGARAGPTEPTKLTEPTKPAGPAGPAGPGGARPGDTAPPDRAVVTATLDGRAGSWPVRDGEPLLDAVLRGRADAPYACKGGVCGTCRAFLVSGRVRMERNHALEPDEVAAGYVLACQSHPVSEEVELDFDR
ncbi:2Fe-2S iron-sulfur cluster-binding protein [Streptomyces sp. B1866]|uniref:2Fe-2S iron-sulfur cluster-binding protein n=1 Tax=Streptomyces sp. B1866 TaxID=3075431 RepID=UPI00288E7518|nr:2Fe-2S iron-sulfur cluster-binding protein [Streptomyces sp. B1866]MDT3398280.1 2Fe-2S iron-sulfur cluster-binding protein [Streptomyces sp. B1866]